MSLDQIERNIRERGLIADGQRVLVAVSGGVDSMVLLRALGALSGRHGWRLRVAHLNHQLRGRASDADERLVRRVVAELGLPVTVERAEVRADAAGRGVSIEMAARELRHAFLARVAVQHGLRTVALAHHADDQVELFLLRLLRGSGGEGLGGMKWRAPSPAAAGVELIRPLLDLPKAALLDFAAQHEVPYREDATNAALDLQRNRIRNELLPLLERRYQPGLRRTIPRVMEILRAEAEFASAAAQRWNQRLRGGRARRGKPALGWLEAPAFGDLPVAVQRRSVQLQLFELGLAAEFDAVEFLRLSPDRALAVAWAAGAPGEEGPAALVVRGGDGRIRLDRAVRAEFGAESRAVTLASRKGGIAFGGLRLSWDVSRVSGKMVFRATTRQMPAVAPPMGVTAAGREVFDAEAVGAEVVLRHWRPGDRFQPIGMQRDAKLQDLFVNQKIPRGRRCRLVVAATAAGGLFWVEGLRMSERFKVTENTKHRLHWRWERA